MLVVKKLKFISLKSGLFILVYLFPLTTFAQILHLELGAANYDGPLFEDPELRFLFLQRTTQDLINEYGPEGSIYLNDIAEDGLENAAIFLTSWLHENGYDDIDVIKIPGNYENVDLPHVKTAQLGNPGTTQIPGFQSFEDNARVVKALENIAALSETGLKITSYFVGRMAVLQDRIKTSELIVTGKEGYPYFHASEHRLDDKTEVFILKPKEKACIEMLQELESSQ